MRSRIPGRTVGGFDDCKTKNEISLSPSPPPPSRRSPRVSFRRMRPLFFLFCLLTCTTIVVSVVFSFLPWYDSSSPGAKTNADRNQQERKRDVKADKEKIVNIFGEAGIEITEWNDELPLWSEIEKEFGSGPIIYGLDKCETYRSSILAVKRNIGCCGMFNSGTNLVTRLLKENCVIPERVEYYGWDNTMAKWGMGPGEAHGIRWQVPWGKHTHAKYREEHSTEKAAAIEKDTLLPIVTIRHPYGWMTSMCEHPYTAKWPHSKICPHLVNDPDGDGSNYQPVRLTIQYGEYFEDKFDSLAHLWNDWYQSYWKNATYPFLMVRFEDLIFHTKNVTTQICSCAGGTIRDDRPFYYIIDSAKQGPGHGKERTGMEKAWIRYKRQPDAASFSQSDAMAAVQFLDHDLMRTFGYRHPADP